MPRLTVELPLSNGRPLGGLSIASAMLVLGAVVGFLTWPLAGVTIAGLGASFFLILWMMGYGARTEVLEVDPRYTTVTRGKRVYAWPTAGVGDVRVVETPSNPRRAAALFAGNTPGQSVVVGGIEWGTRETSTFGTAGSGLDSVSTQSLVDALRVFLRDHPADASIHFSQGEVIMLRKQ